MALRSSWSSDLQGTSWFAGIVLAALAVAGLLAAILAAADQRASGPAGAPLVEFEIELPAGTLLPDNRNISVMLWNGGSGRGCKVTQVRRSGARPVVAGSFVAGRNNDERLSLQLSHFSEGHWKMPVKARTPIEKTFGAWQPIEFVPSPRQDEAPLPPGDYQVRYRVVKYM